MVKGILKGTRLIKSMNFDSMITKSFKFDYVYFLKIMNFLNLLKTSNCLWSASILESFYMIVWSMLGSGRHAFGGSIDIIDSDDEMPKETINASTDCVYKSTSSRKQPSQRMKSFSLLNGTGIEDTLKRKQASSSTHNPVFLKRFKATTNVEENRGDTYDILDCDNSFDSDSEADGGFPFDPVITIARSSKKRESCNTLNYIMIVL